jgi:hypothetical protein
MSIQVGKYADLVVLDHDPTDPTSPDRPTPALR